MKTINLITTVFITVIITMMVTVVITQPMSKSEAHNVLSENGVLMIDDWGIEYIPYHQGDEGYTPTLVELEALATLGVIREGLLIKRH